MVIVCGKLWRSRGFLYYTAVTMTRIQKWSGLVFFVFFYAFLASCKTAPSTTDAMSGETENLPLEPGAQVYVLADVQAARPILELLSIKELAGSGADAKQMQDMLNRTKSAAAALYRNESGRRFQLTAWGNYPNVRAGMAMGMSKEWKKRKTAAGLPYWYSAGSALSLSLNSKQVFVSTSADGPFASPPGVEPPEGFAEFRRGAILSCWLEQPGPAINQVFAQMEIPLQIPAERIMLSLFSADSQYQALIRIETASPSHARSLAALLGIARNFGIVPPRSPAADSDAEPDLAGLLAAVLFANPPVQDGQNLNLKTAELSKKEIALLFKIFSIYFE
jgi:hypothetical protein